MSDNKQSVTLSPQEWDFVLSVLNTTPLPYYQTHPVIGSIVRQLSQVHSATPPAPSAETHVHDRALNPRSSAEAKAAMNDRPKYE